MYKDEFLNIARTNIKREGITALLDKLQKGDFFTAPASTKYHDAEEFGLVKHSIKVYNELVSAVGDKYSKETLAIVALFHDLCKVGYYEVSSRNVKDERGKWIQVPYYTVNDRLPYGHGEKSVYMASSEIKLTVEESMAIRWHMGAYEGQQNWNTLSNVYENYPLALYLHQADMRASYLK